MDPFEDRIRGALRQRAESVRPDPATWDEVERRIRRRQVTVWAVPATALAAVAAVAFLVVPGLLPAPDEGIDFAPADPSGTTEPSTGDDADPGTDPPAHTDDPSSDDTSSDDVGDGDDSMDDEPVEDGPTATVFYVRSSSDRLWVEPAEVPVGTETLGVARAAVEALVAGAPEGLDTLAPPGTRVLGAAIRDGVLHIDVTSDVREGRTGAEGELSFAQQLAHTAAQFDGVDAVRLLVDGQEVVELWGHLDWSEPIAPDPFVLSPVTIEDVVVSDGTVTVSGQAMTYEATVDLTLLDPSGAVVERTWTTAECGAPCRGEWTHAFTLPAGAAGTWTVEAAEPQVTTEGRDPFVTSADIVAE